MSVTPDRRENTPEPPLSELCVNLENKFMNMPELSKAEGMRVYARIRPMLGSEIEAGYTECIGLVDDQVVRAVVPSSSVKYKMTSHLSQGIMEDFTFTAAYGPETGQFVFFEDCMMDTMQNFIEGQNSLVFSYGTTGSGKTFTLQGNPDNPGIIPLSLHLFFASIEDQLFDRIVVKPDKFADVIALNDNDIKKELELKTQLLSACDQEEWSLRNSSSSKSFAMMLCDTFSEKYESEGRQTTLCPEEMSQAQAAALMKEISKKCADQQLGYCNVWVSFVEIYNENIYDLLQPNVNQRTKLILGEDKNGDVFVKGLREVCVSNSYEALKLLNFGKRNLKIASTKLNYQSSRSHCIFTIKVIRIPDPNNMTYAKVNRLSFCDLAGSERAAKSQTTGLRLKEAGCINTSLLVLGRCLEQLRLNPSLRDKKLIPFRESKLTRLFSGFFTGRGKAVMITNASPSELTFDETLHVLRFSAVAKELIINDSYIATASSTLQSITNMWTSVKSNCRDTSHSSDKSISFEDSMADALQEKDELIEKLLDLAESLRNNLEREKKEKAELEIKIRQDVCQEYSEYSDELLDNQKQTFEEERETIKEIYQKRIAAMEKMYENIIKDYKLQLEESESSGDETCDFAVERRESKNTSSVSEVDGNAVKDQTTSNADSIPGSNDTAETVEKSKIMKELEKTVDYSLSLETELDSLRKNLEDTQLQLQNAMKESEDMKKELDAYKIDCLAYKTDNDNLLKAKVALEDDIKSLTEDLASVSHEREALCQKLADSENQVASYSVEIENLFKRINEMVMKQKESAGKHERALEEANEKTDKANDILITTSRLLEEEKEERMKLESHVTTLEMKISELQTVEKDNIQIKNYDESLLKEIDDLKKENAILKEQLEAAKNSATEHCQSVLELKDEIEKLNAIHIKTEEKLNDYVKQHEIETKEAKEVLIAVNKTLDNALMVTEEQKGKLEVLEAECSSLKNELVHLQSMKEELEKKLESMTEMLESEKKIYQDQLDVVNNNLEKSLSTISTQKIEMDNLVCENERNLHQIADLKKLNEKLEDKINSQTSLNESTNLVYKQELDNLSKKLEEAQLTINKQNNELQRLNKEVEDKINSQVSQAESANLVLKQELDNLNKKLDESQQTINKQDSELQRLNEEMENKIHSKVSETEAANLVLKQELDDLNKKLDEAQQTINKQDNELQRLNEEMENKIHSELSETEKDDYKHQLDDMNQKLEDALSTITAQRNELDNLMLESSTRNNEIAELKKSNSDLVDKINSHASKDGIIFDLVQILENCEMQATHKAQKMHSELEQHKAKLETISIDHEKEYASLHKLIDTLEKCEILASNRTKELHTSCLKHVEQMMDIEAYAKSKDKSIEALNNDKNSLQKQLRDLQASFKKQLQTEKQQYMSLIDDLKIRQADTLKENESLKPKLAKLQTEKQQYISLIDDLKSRQADALKENEHLKPKLAELQADIERLETENKALKLKKTMDKYTDEVLNENDSTESGGKKSAGSREKSERRSRLSANKVQNENNATESCGKRSVDGRGKSERRSRSSANKAQNENISVENTGKKSVDKREKSERSSRLSAHQVLKEHNATETGNKKSVDSREKSERKPRSSANKMQNKNNVAESGGEKPGASKEESERRKQGQKRKNKQNSEKSDVEDKKQKAKIYEETDENNSNENTRKERKGGRKHLRCMENMATELNLVQNKDKDSIKSKAIKRKEGNENDGKILEQKALKKLKVHDNNDTENISKPQNLRVKLLRAAIAVNDIPAPSPRMTRGRKRLVQAKEITQSKASPRTVRS